MEGEPLNTTNAPQAWEQDEPPKDGPAAYSHPKDDLLQLIDRQIEDHRAARKNVRETRSRLMNEIDSHDAATRALLRDVHISSPDRISLESARKEAHEKRLKSLHEMHDGALKASQELPASFAREARAALQRLEADHKAELASVTDKITTPISAGDQVAAEATQAELDKRKDEIDVLAAELAETKAKLSLTDPGETESLRAELAAANEEKEAAHRGFALIKAERDDAIAARDEARAERDQALQEGETRSVQSRLAESEKVRAGKRHDDGQDGAMDVAEMDYAERGTGQEGKGDDTEVDKGEEGASGSTTGVGPAQMEIKRLRGKLASARLDRSQALEELKREQATLREVSTAYQVVFGAVQTMATSLEMISQRLPSDYGAVTRAIASSAKSLRQLERVNLGKHTSTGE